MWPSSSRRRPNRLHTRGRFQRLVLLVLRLTLERFVDLTSAGPARIFGMRAKGRLAPGYDCDLTLVDLSAKKTITNEWSKSKCGWTPFDGMQVTGWPMATVVRGRFVMRDGALQGQPGGQPVVFD